METYRKEEIGTVLLFPNGVVLVLGDWDYPLKRYCGTVHSDWPRAVADVIAAAPQNARFAMVWGGGQLGELTRQEFEVEAFAIANNASLNAHGVVPP